MDQNSDSEKTPPDSPQFRESQTSLPLDFSFGLDAPRDIAAREDALQLLKQPANSLRTVALLQFYAAIAQVVGGAYVVLSEESKLEPLFAAAFTANAALSLVSSAMVFVASHRMKALRSYKFVVASILLACLGGLTACPLATIALLSPLILILRPDVRRHFDREPRKDDGAAPA